MAYYGGNGGFHIGQVYTNNGLYDPVYDCYFSYEATRSGNTINFTNIWIRISKAGNTYTTNRVAARFNIGGNNLNGYSPYNDTYSTGVTIRAAGTAGNQDSSEQFINCSVSNVTGSSVPISISIVSTGYSTNWDNFQASALSYSVNAPVPAPSSNYTVGYNASGGTGTVPSSHTNIAYGSSIALKSGASLSKTTSTTFVATFDATYGTTTKHTQNAVATSTYTFLRWRLGSTTGTPYNVGSSYTVYSNQTFYAEYGTPTTTYSNITLPTATECTKNGYILSGWSTDSEATTATYNPGQSLQLSVNQTFYAVWRPELQGGHVLRSLSNTATWADLIAEQSVEGSTLYDVGGKDSLWSINKILNNWVFYGDKVILTIDGNHVTGTSVPKFGETYIYYNL